MPIYMWVTSCTSTKYMKAKVTYENVLPCIGHYNTAVLRNKNDKTESLQFDSTEM